MARGPCQEQGKARLLRVQQPQFWAAETGPVLRGGRPTLPLPHQPTVPCLHELLHASHPCLHTAPSIPSPRQGSVCHRAPVHLTLLLHLQKASVLPSPGPYRSPRSLPFLSPSLPWDLFRRAAHLCGLSLPHPSWLSAPLTLDPELAQCPQSLHAEGTPVQGSWLHRAIPNPNRPPGSWTSPKAALQPLRLCGGEVAPLGFSRAPCPVTLKSLSIMASCPSKLL